jgi:Restriction endonuclease
MDLSTFIKAALQMGAQNKGILTENLEPTLQRMGVTHTHKITSIMLPGWRLQQRPVSLPELLALTPSEFESWCSIQVSQLGLVTMPTKRSGDGGVDILAMGSGKRMVVSVKRYRDTKIPPSEIRRIEGTRSFWDCNTAMIITCGEITKNAIQEAEAAKSIFHLVSKTKILEPKTWLQ